MSAAVLQALNEWQRDEFTYGRTDCCQLANHVAKAISGRDYLTKFSYSTEAEAMQILEELGGLRSAVISVLGEPIDDPKDGAPVLVEVDGLELLGVKLGETVVCLTKKGLAQFQPSLIKCGWAI